MSTLHGTGRNFQITSSADKKIKFTHSVFLRKTYQIILISLLCRHSLKRLHHKHKESLRNMLIVGLAKLHIILFRHHPKRSMLLLIDDFLYLFQHVTCLPDTLLELVRKNKMLINQPESGDD